MHSLSPVLIAMTTLVLLADILAAGETLTPLTPSQAHLEGELGRRMAVTIRGNLMAIDLPGWIRPFQNRGAKGNDAYIGLGKTLDGTVRLAASTRDAALIAIKDKTIAGLLATQDADGYPGIIRPESRTWELWDLHEQSYLIVALA